jgi:hypothetical protein
MLQNLSSVCRDYFHQTATSCTYLDNFNFDKGFARRRALFYAASDVGQKKRAKI